MALKRSWVKEPLARGRADGRAVHRADELNVTEKPTAVAQRHSPFSSGRNWCLLHSLSSRSWSDMLHFASS
ncbi:unnamed protein product [Gadus morhua 'NCC']